MKFILTSLVGIFLVLSLNFGTVFAQKSYQFPEATDGQISEALLRTVPIRFLPSNPLYFLISFKEFFSRAIKPNAIRKASFDFQVCGKRLKEAYLLVTKGDIKNANKSLASYEVSIERTIKQIDEVKSHNLDTNSLTVEIAEGLKTHEILLYEIRKQALALNADFDTSTFDGAVSKFVRMIMVIDEINPGVKDRFRI